MIGWARLSAQQAEGSGYNLSASELASGLALAGHDVCYIRSGMDYSLRPDMFLRHVETWRGVRCYHIFNSPNLAISRFNFQNTNKEMNCPEQTRLVMRWLDEQRAEIVHVHALEGFSMDLMAAIRESGRPLLVTPHNHWYVCPQVDLLAREVEVCLDHEGGRRCVACISTPRPGEEIWRRKLGQTMHRLLGRNSVRSAREARATLIQRIRHALDKPPVIVSGEHDAHPGLAWQPPSSADAASRQRETPVASRVHAPDGLDPASHGPALARSTWDTNEQAADPARRDVRLRVVNVYGKRRHAGIDAINRADLVLGPSRSLLSVLTGLGLAERKARFVRYGQPHLDQLRRLATESPFYRCTPWAPDAPQPLRLAFHGTVHNNKGLDVLTRAIPLLSDQALRRCHFTIRAWGDDTLFRRRLRRFPQVTFAGGFDTVNLPGMMGQFDVGVLSHTWLENCPLVMLEFLSAGKFTIAARLGGPAEFIHPPSSAEPGNGLLFSGGCPDELAACIERIADGRVRLPTPEQVHAASDLQTYVGHVREVMACYEELLAARGAEPAQGASPLAPEPKVLEPAAR
ncbi:MAG: glycosyltransferase [Planctomycetota bacterium]|nr:glycosyltransferase [Planctomycetota bacterium]